MKRFTILAIMALFLLGTVATASAVDMKASGSWRVSGNWWKNQNNFDNDVTGDNFNVMQRARTYFEFIANEDLKGVLKTEIGDFAWGNGAGEVSGDVVGIEVKNAYLDFNIPNTEVNIKAGLQGLTLPGFVGGSPLFDDDVTGIVFNAPINDMVGITGGWARLQDQNATLYGSSSSVNDTGDNVDLAFTAVPLTFDGLQFVPYFGYAWVGEKTSPWGGGLSNRQAWMGTMESAITTAAGTMKDSSAWYAGIPFQLSMFDPLVVSADVHYGRMDVDMDGSEDIEIKGWLADFAVEYKMDMMTPMFFGSYSTGVDKDDANDDEYGIYPAINGFWAVDTVLTDGGAFAQDMDLYQPVSMWTLGFRLKDISFVEDLTHSAGILYARGTTDDDQSLGMTFAGNGLLNENESLWAADFTTKYMIYENLAAIAELGYVKYNPDDDILGDDNFDDNSYKAVVGFKYDF